MTRREAQPLKSKPMEDDDKETAGTTRLAHQVFKNVLMGGPKSLKMLVSHCPWPMISASISNISHAY